MRLMPGNRNSPIRAVRTELFAVSDAEAGEKGTVWLGWAKNGHW
jgi:hypothetical protein